MSQTQRQIAPSQTEASTSKPRLGFIGVGWIGWHRMKAIAESALADVCMIVEPHAEMARRAQELAPDAEVIADVRDCLSSGIDGLVIATPSALHAEMAIAALRRGISVFCQKPLGLNRRETQNAIDAARAADRLLKVDLCYRFVTAAVKIRELIRNGDLGDVFAMDLVFHNAYGPDKAWFYDPQLSGGGCLIDLGIHLVDLALWLLDFPPVEHVSGRLYENGRRYSGRKTGIEDFALANVRLENGISVTMSCSWKAHAGEDAVIQATVYGTKGGAKLHNVNGSFYDFVAEQYIGRVRRTLVVPPDEWGGRAAIDWVRRLCKSNRFDRSIEDLSIVAEVLDRIYDA